ncbi:hypothetical protein H6P81_003013 [Aristolochia fimbriata]|uniref:CID domain-containing protein n=1 Tax=Aristolochia fimbriata TaxID=158543 RepID=A0AAV7FBE3_ARIFI|nr:hypothetical protein H6P81_003013 [Aristolochia fimbriata]
MYYDSSVGSVVQIYKPGQFVILNGVGNREYFVCLLVGKGKMSNAFNSQTLAEKLSKVNNSQQSIETLSHWCIFHRKKARQVVETWEKLFNSCLQEQRVPFLYLANDILQNSRRKGSEFVNEFWKVLPKVLKDVVQNGDDHVKSVVARLVDIWDERKVFGSRGRGLKDEMFGTDPPKETPVLVENNGKSSNSIKIVKKDAHSIRIKMAVGGMPEKIVTAFQSVHDEHFNEDTTLNKCRVAVRRVEKIEKDVDDACTHGNQQGSSLANDLEELEIVLKQCMHQLGSIEAARGALIARLKEALQEQESKLEVIRTQMQIALVQTELASSMRQRLSSSSLLTSGISAGSNPTLISTSITGYATAAASTPPSDSASAPDPNVAPVPSSTGPLSPLPQPVTSFATPPSMSDEQQKKAAAAAMAAKLAASTSSAQMLSSVLSSLAAEEAAAAAASMSSGGSNSSPFATALSAFPPEKRPKLEKPMTVADITSSTYFNSVPQNNQLQPPFPPPPPPLPPGPPQVQQFVQSNGLIVGVTPYAFNSSSGSSLPHPPPPPPPPSNILVGLPRPATPSQTQTQPQQQQHSVTTGFYQSPPGMGFYGQNHPTTPPVHRQ